MNWTQAQWKGHWESTHICSFSQWWSQWGSRSHLPQPSHPGGFRTRLDSWTEGKGYVPYLSRKNLMKLVFPGLHWIQMIQCPGLRAPMWRKYASTSWRSLPAHGGSEKWPLLHPVLMQPCKTISMGNILHRERPGLLTLTLTSSC
jgi:hypothetical protein